MFENLLIQGIVAEKVIAHALGKAEIAGLDKIKAGAQMIGNIMGPWMEGNTTADLDSVFPKDAFAGFSECQLFPFNCCPMPITGSIQTARKV